MKCFLFASVALVSSLVVAQSLADLPDGPAIKIGDDGSYQITCVATATYDFNDPEDILDARKLAELRAKSGIAKFLKEDISSQDAMDKVSVKAKENVDGQKSVSKTSVTETFESIRSSASALLTGVVVLQDEKIPEGDGGYYKVMVGVSSKTQSARNALAAGDLGAPTPATPAPVAPADVSPTVATPAAVADAPAPATTAVPASSPGLPEGWYECVGMGHSRQRAVQDALVEGISMVYGQLLQSDERMSERSKKFSGKGYFNDESFEGKAKSRETEHVTNSLSKTAGFVREYRIVNVVEKGDMLEATVHAHIVNPRANNIVALLIYPPTIKTKLGTKLLNVGPKKKMSGTEVGEAIANVLPNSLENTQKFIILTAESLDATLLNKRLTELAVDEGVANASELSNVGGVLTADYGLHVEISDINYSKKMGLDKETKKFGNVHKMTIKLVAKVFNERMGKILKTTPITLTLENEEITQLLEEDEDVDLIETILMKLAEPIQEIIETTPVK